MALRIIAGLIGLLAGITSWFLWGAGHVLISVVLSVAAVILELFASSPLPKGETWRSLPRDDHFKR